MAASLKYFGVRILNALVVLFIVIFIISASFSSLADEQLEQHINEQIRGQSQTPEIQQLNETAYATWKENKEEQLRSQYGLDQPLPERIVNRTVNTFLLNFEESHSITAADSGSQNVLDIIMAVLPRTVLLFTTSATIYIALGLIVGLKAAQVAGSKMDKLLSLFGMTASSMPMWWLGMIAILIFAYELRWFPATAYPFPRETGFEYYKGVLYRMALPTAVIVFNLFGARAWATRNIVTDVLQDDYIMAARAKGVPERKVIYGHTLKTAAPPIVTTAILTFLMSIGGAMITEIIFGWPGMGRLYYQAVFEQRDVPVVLGLTFITTFMYVFGYVIADMVYGLLDPRVEVGAQKSV
ncbi:MAG: ABC transporter permease [Thermoplasmatota archaeon]